MPVRIIVDILGIVTSLLHDCPIGSCHSSLIQPRSTRQHVELLIHLDCVL